MAIPAAEGYPQRTVDTVRRSVGWNLVGTANMLENQAKLEGILGGPDKRDFLDPKELEAVEKVVGHLEACARTLHKLSGRLGVER